MTAAVPAVVVRLGRAVLQPARGAVGRPLARLLDALVPLLVREVLDRVDLTSLVRERVDLTTLAREVVDGIDLPEIIRASTGSVASETVQGVRMRGVAGDEAVGRMVGRLLRRPMPGAPPVPGRPAQ